MNVFQFDLAKKFTLDHYGNEAYIQRLFPHGGAIILSEEIMLKQPETSLAIIQWFEAWVHKKFPGTWKLVVRPNIRHWLLLRSREDPSHQETYVRLPWHRWHLLI